MEIKAGNYYRTRNGLKAHMDYVGHHHWFPAEGTCLYSIDDEAGNLIYASAGWIEDGVVRNEDQDEWGDYPDSDHDLVDEWREPETVYLDPGQFHVFECRGRRCKVTISEVED